jgi:maleylpyruvate isomerase
MTEPFDPSPVVADIADATARLLDTVRSMSDDDVLGPSLLPGWSRGHVLTHVARNADGLANRIGGVAEGVERSSYRSREARNADIEAGARRPVTEQVADIEAAHERLLASIAAVPAHQWDFVLLSGTGGPAPARTVPDTRFREVAIHHIDLDAGYAAADWPPELALRILRSVLPAFEVRGLPPCTLYLTDVLPTDGRVPANGGSSLEIRGPAHALVTWLTGRADGAGLVVEGGALPTPSAW